MDYIWVVPWILGCLIAIAMAFYMGVYCGTGNPMNLKWLPDGHYHIQKKWFKSELVYYFAIHSLSPVSRNHIGDHPVIYWCDDDYSVQHQLFLLREGESFHKDGKSFILIADKGKVSMG